MKISLPIPIERLLLVLGILLVWGVIKIHWENELQREQESLRYHGMVLSRSLREQMGQGATIATLAGMRALVANYFWCVSVESSWERRDWFKLKSFVDLVTTLEPRSTEFWDQGSWHLAWNAALDCRRTPNEPEVLRIRDERFWVNQGIQLLERGIENNPEKMDLWWKLGRIYELRKGDYLKAAAYYKEALKRPNPPQYLERFVGYDLEKGGDLEGAYDWWKKVWFSTTQRNQRFRAWDVVELHIRRLEDKLRIPQEKRVFPGPNIRDGIK